MEPEPAEPIGMRSERYHVHPGQEACSEMDLGMAGNQQRGLGAEQEDSLASWSVMASLAASYEALEISSFSLQPCKVPKMNKYKVPAPPHHLLGKVVFGKTRLWCTKGALTQASLLSPQHCLVGWENVIPFGSPTMSSLDLRTSLEEKPTDPFPSGKD